MREQMSQLAESFPTLQGVPGVRPWQPTKLARQLGSPARTHASAQAILFVLSVWNPKFEGGGVDLHKTPFDLHSALMSWDSRHLAAFHEWVLEPWWP